MTKRTLRSVIAVLFALAMTVSCANIIFAENNISALAESVSESLTVDELYDATHAKLPRCQVKYTYTSMGDKSALAGYADKVASALKISGGDYKNLASADQRVSDTLALVSKNGTTIKNSSIISLGYSSNVFLNEAISQIDLMLLEEPVATYNWVGLIGNENAAKVQAYLDSLEKGFKDDGFNMSVMGVNFSDMLVAALEGYSYKMAEHMMGIPDVIDAIHTLNPNATVILVGMYNPFDGIVLDVEGKSFSMGEYIQRLADAADELYLEYAHKYDNTVFVKAPDVETIAVANGTAANHDMVSFVWDLLMNYTADYYPSAAGNEYIKSKIIDSLVFTDHVYKGVVTEPTCLAEGYTTYTCVSCKNSYIGDKVAALSHKYSTKSVPPTCTSKGYTTYTCTVCGCSYDGDYVDVIAHSYNKVVTAPTCTEKGYTTYTCKVCGDNHIGDYVDVIAHSYNKVVTKPTCTEKGYTTYTCKVCGDNHIGDYVDVIAHSYNKVVTAPTCTEKGYTTYTCKVCGDSYVGDRVNETGHSYNTVVTEPTCTTGGYTTYICTVCGDNHADNYTDPLGHIFGAWIITREPTEEAEGEKEHTCASCGIKETASVPVLGHTHKYVSSVVEPTCTDKGYTIYKCACGDSYTEDYVNAAGHSYSKTVTAPTCTSKGYTTYTCTVCGYSYDGDYVEVTAHSYNKAVTAPTCTSKGYTTYTCTACGHSYVDDYVDAAGHSYNTSVTAPTCTDKGYTTYTCKVCGDSYVDTYVNAAGHSYGEWAEVKAPDCIEAGEEKRSCACGDTETRAVNALGHDFSPEFTVDVEATTEAAGQKSRHCTRCSEVTDVTEIPKLTPSIDTSTIYKDVKPKSWFKSAVDYVVSNGLMNGMTADTFEPNTTMSRAMLVTVLWRLEGSPETDVAVPFTDLKQAWYKGAVAWAYANSIVNGTAADKFSPNGNITREQMAAILYRYSEYKGHDTEARADLGTYPDAGKVHDYAYDAFSWANAEGLITGTTGNDGTLKLAPRASATRAQVATILMRFCEGR